ncbi:MAG: Mu transposase C-terminal domain-containing protein, partial [Paracoccus sp. (in: a-proteobacteria)]|nr:Mu transposase C-terminal domain-containing protein [Paracoccus sp. (in: a-proteobacteria)]
ISARRRRIMEARANVVIEVRRREILEGSASKAVAGLLSDAREGILSEALMAQMTMASDRKRSDLPSRSRIFEWRRAYQDGGAKALLPEVRPQETRQDHPDWLPAFLRFLCRPAKPTMAKALDDFRASLADPALAPSYDQVRRAMIALQGTARYLDAFKGREGPLALKARMAFVRRSIEGIEPTEIYTSDGKTFDAYVAHPIHGRPFRPEITPVLDVATRKCVGWSVDLAENSRGVADALRAACASHGIPAIFYTDRGPGFRNEVMDHETMGICGRLSITTTHSLPYVSQSRGVIERAHRTIWTPLAKSFATYCGEDMDREAFQRGHKSIGREIREFGQSKSLPSWDEFVTSVETAIADYNDRPHASLRIRDADSGRMRKASPNEIWADFEAKGFEPISLEPGEADDLFRPYFKRRARRGEVQWNNNQYFHLALQPFDGMDVVVGVDIHDASRVWVRSLEELDGRMVPGALICVADFAGNAERYMPVSFSQKAMEDRAKGRKRRLDVKQAEIEEEARGVHFLEGHGAPPANFIDLVPSAQPEPVSQVRAIADVEQLHTAPDIPARRHWDDDADLALRVLENPQSLTPGWARLLREKMQRPAGRSILRDAGVDLGSLQDLIETTPAAAGEQTTKRTIA